MINRIRNSAERFDSAIDGYFKSCRDFRSKSRKGTVLVVDGKKEIVDFLNFLVTHCNLRLNVIHITNAAQVRMCLRELGEKRIKAIIIDSHMMRMSAAAEWLDKNHPEIPIFISNCEPERVPIIKRTAQRAGVLASGESKVAYVDALGLPKECHDMAIQYGF